MQIKICSTFDKELLDKIFNLTKPINDTYSSHNDWLENKFIPNIQKGDRVYIVSLNENGDLTGCSLLKDTKQEKKICTLFVDSKYRHQGIASALMNESVKVLDGKPLITVADKNLSQLLPLLKKYGFKLTSFKEGVYTKGSIEYYFNEKKDSNLSIELAKLKQISK